MTLALSTLFVVIRAVDPWTVLSIASWSITFWLAIALVASAIGLLTA